MQSTDVSGPLCILKPSNLVRIQLVALAYAQGRVHFLPYCKIVLKAAKITPCPKELRTVGDHVKRRRLDLGLYQKDVAASLKVNDWTICNWENNQTTPAVRYLPRIIEFLGYDPYGEPERYGEMIAARRRQCGLSRKRLAKQLSMDEMTLARYEDGVTQPKAGQQVKLEEFLAGSSPSVSKAAERNA